MKTKTIFFLDGLYFSKPMYLCVNADFPLTFLSVNSISFRRILTVLWQIFIPVSSHLFVLLYIFDTYYFENSVLKIWCFRCLPIQFSFSTTPFLCYLHQILDTVNWKQPVSFATVHRGCPSWMGFTFPSITSIDSSTFPFSLVFPAACWVLQELWNNRPIFYWYFF